MNYLFLSPHFPPNWFNFCVRLKELGFTVLALGEESYDNLKQELKLSITEYYKIQNMNSYNEVIRGVGYFTWKYGKITYVESHNEHWLELEAKIRDDFNISGYRVGNLSAIKRKSKMKRVFQTAKIPVVPGQLATSFEVAKDFVERVNYPIIGKPDIGVGAYATYKIQNDDDLLNFFSTKPDVLYFLEPFVNGTIITYDGLTDQNGNIVFSTSLQYSDGIMEVVNNDLDIYYWIHQSVPDDIQDFGQKMVKAFDPKARFFHMEFFRLENGEIIALEANLRPPGGFTIDMWNWANDVDLYKEYGHILRDNKVYSEFNFPYLVFFFGRKRKYNYKNSHQDILNKFSNDLVFQTQMPKVFNNVMGNDAYIFRVKNKENMKQIVDFVGSKN